jgi:hypothetical protein
VCWGGLPSEGIDPDFVGKKAPTDSGYTEIYSNEYAFAALKADGSITTWGIIMGTRIIHLSKTQRINTHHLNFC